MNRIWAHFTRKIKKPYKGCRVLGKDGTVLHFTGRTWKLFQSHVRQVAVFSTGKIYFNYGGHWVPLMYRSI